MSPDTMEMVSKVLGWALTVASLVASAFAITQARRKDLHQERIDLESSEDAREKDFNDRVFKWSEKWEARANALESQLSELTGQVQRLTQEKAQLEEARQADQRRIANLTHKVEDLEKENAQLRETVALQANRITSLEGSKNGTV